MSILTVITADGRKTEISFIPPARFTDLVGGSALVRGFSMPCGGCGRCGKCRVAFEGGAEPPEYGEKTLLRGENGKNRLACRLVLTGDAQVTLPPQEESRVDTGRTVASDELTPLGEGLGFAADMGTTTVALKLYDMTDGRMLAVRGCVNPQRIFGADVISRITAARNGKGEELSELGAKTISELLAYCCREADVPLENVTTGTVAGNTAMCYLLAGKDPSLIAAAPFEADCLFGGFTDSPALKKALPGVKVWFSPCISAYVGGDITAAAVASGLENRPSPALLADIGTNGEIVLCKDGELLCCSTAAGPAFEGAGLSMGMGADDGAVCSARLENGYIKVKTVGDAPARGICGSGIIDLAAAMAEAGIIDETGAMDGDYSVGGVTVTRADVRAVQLAKGAVYGGVTALLAHENVKPDELKSVIIAGGFGSKIDFASAARIGLLPAKAAKIAVSAGNASLDGASLMLLSRKSRDAAKSFAARAKTLELSTDCVFSEAFVDGMMF